MTRALRREGGSAAVELVLVTPLLAALLVFVVFAGRSAAAAGDVGQAAADAARAASLHPTTTAAVAAAHATAQANLTASGVTCASTDVTVDAARLTPGGSVTVQVGCTVTYADLAVISVPGTRTFTGRATEVVDTYRSVTP